MTASQSYNFKAPMNMKAIRSRIIQRIKQRNREKACLDNGLPSPPMDSHEQKLPSEQVMTALMELSDEPTEKLDKERIRERIQRLQEEKHQLFQLMRGLLCSPPRSGHHHHHYYYHSHHHHHYYRPPHH